MPIEKAADSDLQDVLSVERKADGTNRPESWRELSG